MTKVSPVGSAPTVIEETPNLELLHRVMDYIETHPKNWIQSSWFWITDHNNDLVPHLIDVEVEEVNSCGTAMCFAGHAALMEGFPAPPKVQHTEWSRKIDGDFWPESVDAFATKRLGLSSEVAEELFDSENTIEQLREMVDYITEHPLDHDWEDLYKIRRGDDEPYCSCEMCH